MSHKFRLINKGGSQEQINVLDKIALLLGDIKVINESMDGKLTNVVLSLASIDSRIGAIDIKMSNQLLLSQAIADNTSCACTALQQVIVNQDDQTDKIQEIIDLLKTPVHVPEYQFEFAPVPGVYLSTVDIGRGYFEVEGISFKDGILFDQIENVDTLGVVESVTVLPNGVIRIYLKSGLISMQHVELKFRQLESGIIRILDLSYDPVYVIPDEFVVLSSPTYIPYLDTRTLIEVDVVSYLDGFPSIPFADAPWSVDSYELLPFGSENKFFYRLQIKPVASTFEELRDISLLISIHNAVAGGIVPFQLELPEFGLVPVTPTYERAGAAGLDPMNPNSEVEFLLVQNIESFKNGGVPGVDYLLLKFSDIISLEVGDLTAPDAGVVIKYYVPGGDYTFKMVDGYWVFRGGRDMWFLVNRIPLGIDPVLPANLILQEGFLLLGGAHVMGNKVISLSLPLAPAPPVNSFPTVKPTLTNGVPLFLKTYSGFRGSDDVYPIYPKIEQVQFALTIGYVFNGIYEQGELCYQSIDGNRPGTVKGLYSYYQHIDNLAVYCEIDTR